MKSPLIRKVGGEYMPAYQRYREQPAAHCAKAHGGRKYIFTDQIDQLIREIYLSHPGARKQPGVRALAKKVGMPHWALRKRARKLGLARTKELPWSEPELEMLERYAWMSDERIRGLSANGKQTNAFRSLPVKPSFWPFGGGSHL